MADSEQHTFPPSYPEKDLSEVAPSTIPIASANHYLLLFALVLPFALTSIFEFLNQDINQVMGLFQLKMLSFGILLICLKPYAKSLFQTARFKQTPSLKTILWALLYNMFAVAGTNLFVRAFFPEWLELAPNFGPSSSLDYLLLPIALAIIVPLEEELVFRGILLSSYERLFSPRKAFFVVSALFAMVHVIPAQVLIILPTCFIITRAVQVSNSIWTGVLIHMIINGLASVAMLIPAPEEVPLSEGTLTPDFSVSSMVGILGLLLSINIIWIAYRKWGLASTEKPNNPKEIFWTMSSITVVGFCTVGIIGLMLNPTP